MSAKIKRCVQASIWPHALIPLLLLSIAAVGNSATVDVQVINFQFSPATVNVQVGDTVRWTFVNGGHSTTSGSSCAPDGLWNSGILGSGSTFSFIFNTPGTYPYFCIPHCAGGMVGSVTVSAPSSDINLSINPTSVNFGEVKAGGKSDRTITITNSSDSAETLTGTAGNLTGPFSVTGGSGSFSLRPGRSKSIKVRFSPPASGVFSGKLEITHNATNQISPVPLLLSGVGVPPDQLTNPIPQPVKKGNVTVKLVPVATGLTAPNWGVAAPGDDTRLFVTDQPGTLWAITLTTGDKTVFGDFSALLIPLGIVGPGTFDERGLLGIAFHPQYMDNGLLYTFTSEPVNGAADFSTLPAGTTPNCQSVIREWRVPAPVNPASVVDPNSSRVLLRIDKPQFNHNGGGLNFGPDGMLYISLGDGGAGDDQGVGHSPQGNGQDPSNLLGTILRIDPTGSNSANGQYGILTDNPFFPGGNGPFGGQNGCADGFCDEIYAYGFRNPFRFSFDIDKGDIYVGDVGQNDIEEVDVVIAGGNYGWRIKEGSFCFEPNGEEAGFVTKARCGPPDLIEPVAQYDHDEGIAIIGGFVYRGGSIRALQGRYVFGDYSRTFSGNNGRLFFLNSKNIVGNGNIRKSKIQELGIAGQDALNLSVLGFGQDASGELYLLANSTGVPFGSTGIVLKIVP